MASLITVDDTTFRSAVLRQPLPALVCFGAPGCTATAALAPVLAALAARHNSALVCALASTELDLAEQYSIAASPSLLVFHHGNELLRSIGFLPPPLLAMLAADALTARNEYPRLWSPVEEAFEDAAMLPLFAALGLQVQRQQRIINWPSSRRGGRIDLFVYDADGPLTLVESKRSMRNESELHTAARQAHNYAQAMQLPSFVVAAPAGLWVYAMRNRRAVPEQFFSWLDLSSSAAPFGELLLALRQREHAHQ